MQRVAGVLLAALATSPGPVAAVGVRDLAGVNPLQKVIELLTNLQAKIIREAEAQQSQYEDFTDWCGQTSAETKNEIKSLRENAESLDAAIAKATSDEDLTSMKIQELSGQIATDEQDLKAATLIRKKEQVDFTAVDKELADTINTIERAIAVLNKEASGAFLQQRGPLPAGLAAVAGALQELTEAAGIYTARDKAEIAALLQDRADGAQEQGGEQDDALDLGAPDPQAYQSKSGGIVDTLGSMQEKAEAAQENARREEMNAKHNFDLLKQSLDDKLATTTAELDSKKKDLASIQEAKATAQGDKERVTKSLKESKEKLADVQRDCMERADAFETSVKANQAELNALAQAKKLVQDVSRQPGLVQQAALGSSFAQTGMARSSAMRAQQAMTVLTQIRRLAVQTRSTMLAQLVSRIRSAFRIGQRMGQAAGTSALADPFAKVKGLISDMLARLISESEEEANQKAFCDHEMAEAGESKDDKSDQVDTLTTRLEAAAAKTAKLKEEVAMLSRELTELVQGLTRQLKMRQAEHEEFLQVQGDLESGLMAVQTALKVLRDYYAQGDGEGDEASLAQTDAPGVSSASGIIGLLEVVEADFSRNLAEAKTAESTAEDEFQKLKKQCDLDKAAKETEVKLKTQESKSLDKAVSEINGDKEDVQAELSAVVDYLEKLKPQCIAAPSTYEERKKRREAAIGGLKEALEVLSPEG